LLKEVVRLFTLTNGRKPTTTILLWSATLFYFTLTVEREFQINDGIQRLAGFYGKTGFSFKPVKKDCGCYIFNK